MRIVRSRGLIKVWAAHKSAEVETGNPNMNGLAGGSSSLLIKENFELLHTFRLFAKAITGLVMHPVSGLCIASGKQQCGTCN